MIDRPRPHPLTHPLTTRRGFTIIELMVVITILAIVMSMVGYVLVKALELKSVSENRLDDLIGGLAAGRLLERDLHHMPEYADPDVDPGTAHKVYFLDAVTIDGKPAQVLYLKTTPDNFETRNGNVEFVRWFVKGGVLYREVSSPTLPAGWLDLNTALDLDLAPYEVLRGVSWVVDHPLDSGGVPDLARIEVTGAIYPSMDTWSRIEVQGRPPSELANNERPRSVHFEFQIARAALNDRLVQEGGLIP